MNLNEIKDKMLNAAGNKQFLIILFVTALFLIAALYTYKRYVSQGMSKNYVTNNEFNSSNAIESADIYFFHTMWCPHCKTAMPIWNSFKADMEGKKVNGITLNFFEVDCEKDPATAEKFNVKGYPTIKLMKGSQIIEYDAKPSKDTLTEFVNSALAES
jgi:thioredoxin domain-containing protein 10